MHGTRSIKFKIQLENIDSRLAQETKLPLFGLLVDEGAQFSFADVPLASNTRYLKRSRCRRNVRIKS